MEGTRGIVEGELPTQVDGRRGTCFGFEVRSPLPFLYTREGSGDPLDVSRSAEPRDPAVYGPPVVEWLPRPARPLHARLYREGERYHLWVDSGGWFAVDPARGRIDVTDAGDPVRFEERLWSIPAALCLLHRGDLPIHAAAVDLGEGGVLLAGPGRFGKSTLAAAFLQAGYRILSEDQSGLRVAAAPAVIPGPAMLRVRRDMADVLRLQGARMVAQRDDRVSFALDRQTRGDCSPVPLRAIVFLRSAADGPRLERVPPADAVPDLWALSFRVPDEADWTRCFDAVTTLARTVPVWNCYRPLRVGVLAQTLDTIVERLGSR